MAAHCLDSVNIKIGKRVILVKFIRPFVLGNDNNCTLCGRWRQRAPSGAPLHHRRERASGGDEGPGKWKNCPLIIEVRGLIPGEGAGAGRTKKIFEWASSGGDS